MATVKLTILMGDKEVPCRLSMGALRRYQEMTGKEYGEPDDVIDSLRQVYCCAEAEAARSGEKLPLTFEQWLDTLDVDEGVAIVNRYAEALAEQAPEAEPDAEDEKKAPRHPRTLRCRRRPDWNESGRLRRSHP